MPHLVLDIAAQVAQHHDLDAVCAQMHRAMAAQPTFDNPEAIKVRAQTWSHYAAGTQGGDFVHATVRMLAGRDDATKSQVSAALLVALRAEFPDVASITVEIAEMHRPSYAKDVRAPSAQPDGQLDAQTRLEIEAAAFRRLQQHLMQERRDVQNIDLMELSGFCRNCLAKWMQEAAQARGITWSKEYARAEFYGMPYETWKRDYQR